MTDFIDTDLAGARFRNARLTGASFRGVDLSGTVMRGVEMVGVTISGEIHDLVINGVDVAPLISAELDRRDPRRALMRPTTPDGFRRAWTLVEELWDETVARARAMDPALLHERVDEEWSFIETLRHLVFATDAWVRRAIQGDPAPWHPLGLPWDEAPDFPGIPRDRAARLSLDEVLAMRRDRMGSVRVVVGALTDETLAAGTTPVDAPGWPEPVSHPVAECLLIVLNEEWCHRQFAERDLAVLRG